MTTRGRSTALSGTAAAAALLATPCGFSTGDGSAGGGGACAPQYQFEQRIYTAVVNVDFQIDEELGTAEEVVCNDGEGRPPETARVTAYSVKGLSSEYAIAVEHADGPRMFVLGTKMENLPDPVAKFLVSHRATGPGA